jgi:hypothetical protein
MRTVYVLALFAVLVIARLVVPRVEAWIKSRRDDNIIEMLRREGVHEKTRTGWSARRAPPDQTMCAGCEKESTRNT